MSEETKRQEHFLQGWLERHGLDAIKKLCDHNVELRIERDHHEASHKQLQAQIESALSYVRLSLARLKAAHPEWTESMDLDDWDTAKWLTQDWQDWTEHEFAIAMLSRLEGK